MILLVVFFLKSKSKQSAGVVPVATAVHSEPGDRVQSQDIKQGQQDIKRSVSSTVNYSAILPKGWPLKRKYAAFLSHFKMEAASDARYLKDTLERILQAPVFLDSDNLSDLRALGKQAKRRQSSSGEKCCIGQINNQNH